MNIALPEPLESHLRRRVEEGDFQSAEAYVQALIEADRQKFLAWENLTDAERREIQRIGDLVEKSLDSGLGVVADEAYWEAKRQRLR
jgi:Arc/MetJ-type ribon-helix-helix transcriptional regulator